MDTWLRPFGVFIEEAQLYICAYEDWCPIEPDGSSRVCCVMEFFIIITIVTITIIIVIIINDNNNNFTILPNWVFYCLNF